VNKVNWVSSACLFSLYAASVFAESAKAAEAVPRAAILESLRDAIAGTPYSALVVHTKVEITSLPVRSGKSKKGVEEEADEERHIYHARVLETFKGKAYATIRYESITEKGEAVTLDRKPRVLTLCKESRGFYWPGTGASFPADADILTEARRVAKQPVISATASNAQCD
jgi:hypothetical protein